MDSWLQLPRTASSPVVVTLSQCLLRWQHTEQCVFFLWAAVFRWRAVWLTVENDSSPGVHTQTNTHTLGSQKGHLHTTLLSSSSPLWLFTPPPPLLSPGIAAWSISTTTCARAASSLGALPRATSSTTPWWSTARRWGSLTRRNTNTKTHSHFRLPVLMFVFIYLYWERAEV